MSNHMSKWPKNIRETGLVERVCPHGIGHPDPDWLKGKPSHWGVHGCDGCCSTPSPNGPAQEADVCNESGPCSKYPNCLCPSAQEGKDQSELCHQTTSLHAAGRKQYPPTGGSRMALLPTRRRTTRARPCARMARQTTAKFA